MGRPSRATSRRLAGKFHADTSALEHERRPRFALTLRTIVAIVVALAAFAGFAYLGIAPEYYSVRWLRGDPQSAMALRKLYSVAAFATLGFLAAYALRASRRNLSTFAGATLVALCSALIELGQNASGSTEGLAWNAIDVALGALGGALGTRLEHALAAFRRA